MTRVRDDLACTRTLGPKPQQRGFGRIGPAKAPRVPGPTEPYCASCPKVFPFCMLPNSHTHVPATFACVQYG